MERPAGRAGVSSPRSRARAGRPGAPRPATPDIGLAPRFPVREILAPRLDHTNRPDPMPTRYDPERAPDPKRWLATAEADRLELIRRFHRKARIRVTPRFT